MIWEGRKDVWKRHAPLLFPIVGSLKDNTYFYENKKYELFQHGFARDYYFEVFELEKNKVTFKLCSNDGTLKIYPFKFNLFITYELEKDVLKIYSNIYNEDSKKMYFSYGLHPAFNISNLDTCFLEIDAKYDSFLFNKFITDEKYVITEQKVLQLNLDVFKHETLIFENVKNLKFTSLSDNYQISHFSNDFELLGVWIPNKEAPFICLEPWSGIADFSNSNQELMQKKFINCLKPKEKKEYYNEFKFEIIK